MMMDLPEQAERRQEHRGADFGKHDVGKFCPGASAVHGRYQAQDGLARGGQDVLLVCTPPRPQPTPSTRIRICSFPDCANTAAGWLCTSASASVCTHSPPRCSVGGAGAGHTCEFAKEKTHDIMCTAAVMHLLCAPRWSRTTTRAPIGSPALILQWSALCTPAPSPAAVYQCGSRADSSARKEEKGYFRSPSPCAWLGLTRASRCLDPCVHAPREYKSGIACSHSQGVCLTFQQV
jgi:hypothetical protein